MLIRLLLLPPLDYVCARMATSLTKISTPENKKKSFFSLPFYPLLKREWFLDLLYIKRFSHTHTHTNRLSCLQSFCVWSIPSIWIQTLFTLTQSLLFLYISLCSWSTRQTTKLFSLISTWCWKLLMDQRIYSKNIFQLCSSRFFSLLSQFDLI
jgi:hypothetical protein